MLHCGTKFATIYAGNASKYMYLRVLTMHEIIYFQTSRQYLELSII